jgi:single-stranded-DNA-specific exonuclease
VVAPRIGESEQSALGAESLLLAQLLWNRGVRSVEEAAAFLQPGTTAAMGDPRRMGGMDRAVERIRRALGNQELIAIHGDYDVDGVAGAALLADALRGLGARIALHIPNRSRDGYGINPTAVRELAAEGARVMITVDCGISADREIALATSLGIDVIVTDHHTVPAELPAATAVLNPHQAGCDYPYKDLAGGGVAYQLARALLAALLTEAEAQRRSVELAAFAALSTVADVVPLTGENRMIVALGLDAARSGGRPGLAALCELAGRLPADLCARDLAFGVIPRLNAAGRMGEARDALDLLLCEELEPARALAQRLEEANGARRTRVGDILARLEGDGPNVARDGVLVVDGDYPIGLAGLIAARLVDRLAVPCAVIERGPETSRGSIRGVDGIHLVHALEECAALLIQFGGHERAAGFSLRSQNIDAFRAAFGAAVRALRGARVPERQLLVDGGLRLTSVGRRLAELVERFEPLGAGNPNPLFISRGVTVRAAEGVNGGHYRLRVAQGTALCRGMAFRPAFDLPLPGTSVDIVYEVGRSVWEGEERVEIVIRDLRSCAGVASAAATV